MIFAFLKNWYTFVEHSELKAENWKQLFRAGIMSKISVFRERIWKLLRIMTFLTIFVFPKSWVLDRN